MVTGASAAEAIDTLLAHFARYHPDRIELSLDRMYRLLADLGDPHNKLPPVIHVAGTNGKGSTVAFLSAALEASGKTVSTYTSPHLIRFAERYRIAGTTLEDAQLLELFEEIEDINAGKTITEFEITTAAAFLAMSRAPADVAILEVGLGGQFDATNVIARPLATVITRVAMDHMDFLGNTLRDIAGEKAAIQKSGVPSIVGPQDPEAMDAITVTAKSTGAPLYRVGHEWNLGQPYESGGVSYHHGTTDWILPQPSLPGQHQLQNAATAAACLEICKLSGVTEQTVATGIQNAYWPGRLQRLTVGSLADQLRPGWSLWVDVAHNPSGAAAAANMFRGLLENDPRALHLVIAMRDNKDSAGFLAPFTNLATNLTTVPTPHAPQMQDPAALCKHASMAGFKCQSGISLAEALKSLSDDHPPGHILITGSHLLVGAALSSNNSMTLDL
jgi:dihydrofolate synthase/folylpolyglutamate synthase